MDKTNEKLRKKFKSNFDLVNYAINLAKNMIDSGRKPRVEAPDKNRALLVLQEIREGKDQFDEIIKDSSLSGVEKESFTNYEERQTKRKSRMVESQYE
jgi:hypothetical protein